MKRSDTRRNSKFENENLWTRSIFFAKLKDNLFLNVELFYDNFLRLAANKSIQLI